MTRTERRLAQDSALLGVFLTVLALLLDRVGATRPLELALDDFRAKHFQYFTPKPTDKLVHLDIDDATLDFIGNWPWDREKLGRIMDELRIAGTKVVCLDVMFPQGQSPRLDENGKTVRDDEVFAKSISEFGKLPGRGVLIPLTINLNNVPEGDPIYNAMIEELSSNLEIEDTDLDMVLQKRGYGSGASLRDSVEKFAKVAKEQAMFHRIRHELDSGHPADLESLRKSLLPQSSNSGVRTEAYRLLQNMLPRVQSYEAIAKFGRTVPAGLPPLLHEDDEQSPIPILAKAAAFSGFVDLWAVDDSKVRSIPLFALDRGIMLPQMGLALACAELGVNTNNLILAPDSVTIPKPNGGKIVIPVYSRQSGKGETVGMLMDIPWFGDHQDQSWQTMYDWPNYRAVGAQHMPLTKIWDICRIEPDIIANNQGALDAVYNLLAISDSYAAARIRATHPDFSDFKGWDQLIQDTLDNLAPGTLDVFKPLLDPKVNPDTINDPKDHELVVDLRAVLNRQSVNKNLATQREELRLRVARDLGGKAALIGWIATGATDFRPTPLVAECPGVVVHGAIFNAIMIGFFKTHAGLTMPLIFTLLIGLMVTSTSSILEPVPGSIAAAVIIVAYLLGNFYVAYDWYGLEIAAAGPPTAAGLTWGICTIYKSYRQQKEKKQITNRFRSYVDPSLVNFVLEHPEQDTFKGEERELSVVFTDLAGFTSISEILKQDTVALLNEYLGRVVPVITQHRGLVNKFLGDGIMFFYGAPEPFPGDINGHALAAVETVLEMQKVMVPFNEELKQRNLPQLTMRAGVSTGAMVVGDAGNPPDRSDYTVLGDRVNFASRLESANKYTGSLTLISDRTAELLGDKYLLRAVGRIQVVGKDEPVLTYEPLAPVDQATPEMHKLVEFTKHVTQPYYDGRFADCIGATHELLQAFGEKSQGKFCALYRRACLEFLQKPPLNFRGQIKLEAK